MTISLRCSYAGLLAGYHELEHAWHARTIARRLQGNGIRALNILISNKKPKWEKRILEGFKHTPHQLAFADLSQAQPGEHDLIIPLTIPDLLAMHSRRECFADSPIPLPRPEAIHLFDDKHAFACRLTELGFGDYLPKTGKQDSYPYYFKKKIDEWGKNTHIVRDAAEESTLLARLPAADYFAQQAIPGMEEFSCHILCINGRIVDAITLRFVFKQTLSVKGRDKEEHRYLCRSRYNDIFTAILAAAGFSGICCINYKVWHGRPILLEINPRCGQSLSPYLASFVNSAWQTAPPESHRHGKR